MGEERLHPALASSDEHGAEHDARSGRNTAAGEEFTTTPGASEYQDQEEKQGHGATCSGVEEHRTVRRSGRIRSERSTVPRHQDAIDSQGGAHAAGGEAPPSSVRKQSENIVGLPLLQRNRARHNLLKYLFNSIPYMG